MAGKADKPCAARLLATKDAALYLGVPYTTLRDWALRGHVPIVRPPECRRWWFDRQDLDRCLERWKERLDEYRSGRLRENANRSGRGG